MRNIKAICIKEFLHIIRDKRTLMMVIMMPLFQMMIYGFGVNTDIKHLRIYVYDQDQTYLSRHLVDSFQVAETFEVFGYANSYDQIKTALDRGVIKADFEYEPIPALRDNAGRFISIRK